MVENNVGLIPKDALVVLLNQKRKTNFGFFVTRSEVLFCEERRTIYSEYPDETKLPRVGLIYLLRDMQSARRDSKNKAVINKLAAEGTDVQTTIKEGVDQYISDFKNGGRYNPELQESILFPLIRHLALKQMHKRAKKAA